MLLKLLNVRKYFHKIVFRGGAVESFWLGAFTKWMSPCKSYFSWASTGGKPEYFDISRTSQQQLEDLVGLLHPFFPLSVTRSWGQRLRGKIWFALCWDREQVTHAPNLLLTSISKWKHFSVSNTQTLVFLQIWRAWAIESLFWLKFRTILFTITSLNKQH